jgi:hypothetical protein
LRLLFSAPTGPQAILHGLSSRADVLGCGLSNLTCMDLGSEQITSELGGEGGVGLWKKLNLESCRSTGQRQQQKQQQQQQYQYP